MLIGVDEVLRHWAENIKRGRLALGLTQLQLADLIGVRQATVARWESGDRVPRDTDKLKIATALQQDVRQLFPLFRVAPA